MMRRICGDMQQEALNKLCKQQKIAQLPSIPQDKVL
jgi:hypothetical protein